VSIKLTYKKQWYQAVGALWKNKSRKEEDYLSGYLEIENQLSLVITIYKSKRKKTGFQPDFIIYSNGSLRKTKEKPKHERKNRNKPSGVGGIGGGVANNSK